jgi:plasmid stabilization system protein ParE
MTLRLVITAEAERDIDDAAAWYDRQHSGLGFRFVAHLRLRFSDILRSPFQPRAFGRRAFRKVRVPRWPYAVYYRVVDDSEVRVVAVVHGARDPGYLNYRLR